MNYATHFQYTTHIGCTASQQLAAEASLNSNYKHRQALDKLDRGYKQAFARGLRKAQK
ncbi:MAG: hypothetical protein HRU20_26120 [Pseudomonadales bacterium]|nr:hypothetical protein [Pseudomonadales bacterium]